MLLGEGEKHVKIIKNKSSSNSKNVLPHTIVESIIMVTRVNMVEK